MLENWKTILNKKLKKGGLSVCLTKAFDTFYHSLMLAKLSAYDFDNNSLSFVQSSLTKRFSRCKAENEFNSWCEITTTFK